MGWVAAVLQVFGGFCVGWVAAGSWAAIFLNAVLLLGGCAASRLAAALWVGWLLFCRFLEGFVWVGWLLGAGRLFF